MQEIIVPIRSESEWRIIPLSRVYLGGDHQGAIVPNIDDLVIDLSSGATTKVIGINEDSTPILSPFFFSDKEIGPYGPQANLLSDPHRVYVDYSSIPHKMQVDTRLSIPGSSAEYAKVFVGEAGFGVDSCISLTRGMNDESDTNKIWLENVRTNSHEEDLVRVAKQCSVSRIVNTGELLSILIYDAEGSVLRKTAAIAQEVGYLSASLDDDNRVVNIWIDSPYLLGTEPGVLSVPVGTPASQMGLHVAVEYSTGRIDHLPEGDHRVSIGGLHAYSPTAQPRYYDLGFSYKLEYAESSLDLNCSGSIAKRFQIRTVGGDSLFAINLYPILEWRQGEYLLTWAAISSEGSIYTDASDVVQVYNGPEFFGSKYGVTQRLGVRVNASDINPDVVPYIHVQETEIRLISPPDGQGCNWDIYGPIGPISGCVKVNSENPLEIKIVGFNDKSDFIEKAYFMSYPIVQEGSDIADQPTLIKVERSPDDYLIVPIDLWSSDLQFDSEVSVNSTIRISFITDNGGERKFLSIIGFIVI